jgi:hypothetical protein
LNIRWNSSSPTCFARSATSFSIATSVGFEAVHLLDDQLGGLLLLAEFLGALGVVPDLGVFERAADFLESSLLGIDVKDTSGVQRGGRAGPRRSLRSG